MLKCRICNCNCDPGDLKNGICEDCREDMRLEEEKKEELNRIENAEFKQMRLEDILDGFRKENH